MGKDPAYVPGLMIPRPAGTEETDQEQAETGERTPGGAVPPDAVPEDVPEAEPALDEEGASDTAEEVVDGPVFEARDRRGSITADREGVRFRLDDQEADFWWDEIGAVEIKTPRFGRRFTVTVHVSSRRWFDAEVEADTRNRLKEWTAELDAVLDAYFEES